MSQELRHISWRDDGWLAQYGMISTMNALQYFAGSPFTGEPGKFKLDGTGQQRALRSEDGTEFVLQDAQPPHLFVIREEKKTPVGTRPIAAFYILDGTVYQSPTLYDVFENRLKRCSYKANLSIDALRKDLDPLDGVLSAQHSDTSIKHLQTLANQQENAFVSNTQNFLKSDQLIASILAGTHSLPTPNFPLDQ